MTLRRVGRFMAILATILLTLATMYAWLMVLAGFGSDSRDAPTSEILAAQLMVSTPLIVVIGIWALFAWLRSRSGRFKP
jgi:hypothetical protein